MNIYKLRDLQSNIVKDIKETRHCFNIYENESYFEAEDNIYRYRYMYSSDTLSICIKFFSAGRWAVDTDMIVYNMSKKKVSSIFSWANKVLETKSYNKGYGLQLEYPSLLSIKFKSSKSSFINKRILNFKLFK